MKYIVYVFIVFLLGGCGTKVPNMAEYRLDTNPSQKVYEQNVCKQSSLKVQKAFSSTTLMTREMKYMKGTFLQKSYSQSQWVSSPNKIITKEILKYVESTELFNTVQVANSRTKSDLVLETHIEEFIQYFSEDEKSSYVQVVINFTLSKNKNRKILDSRTFETQVDVKTLDAKGGVVALNQALEKILDDMGLWLGESCR